jgi:hypothetical protein
VGDSKHPIFHTTPDSSGTTPRDWITARVDAAMQPAPVANAIAIEIKKQLNGPLQERILRSSEFTGLAKALLAIANKLQPNEEKGQ